MNIVFVTPEFMTEKNFDGGLSNYLAKVSIALKELGHTPIIVVASHSQEIINYKGIEVHRVRTLRPLWFKVIAYITRIQTYFDASRFIWLSYVLNKEVKSIIQNKKIDIIQYPNIVGLALFKPKNVPAVIRLSSYKKIWNEAIFKAIQSKPRLPLYKQFYFLEKLGFKKADRLYAPSKLIADTVKSDLGYEVPVIETPFIQNTSTEDYSVYKELKDKIGNNEYLLYFGTISIRKGIKYLADNLYQILDNNKKIFFVFVGKSSGDFLGLTGQEYILNKAKRYSNRVIILNKLEHSKLFPIIKNAKAVVLPSLVDNLPNTCIEAMALQKPVIAGFNTSLDQLIENNVSGFLFDFNKKNDIVRVINRVVNFEDKKLKKIGKKAYNRTLQMHPDITVRRLIDFYHDLINNSN